MPNAATWWSPSGWARSAMPEPWASLVDFEAGVIKAGYDGVTFGEDGWPYTVTVYDHDDAGHLAVVLDCPDVKWLSVFFVSAGNEAAFYVEKLPAVISAFAANASAEAAQRMAKVFTAFVRHGHGNSTVDAYGETLDEARHRAAVFRQRQAAKRAAT